MGREVSLGGPFLLEIAMWARFVATFRFAALAQATKTRKKRKGRQKNLLPAQGKTAAVPEKGARFLSPQISSPQRIGAF